MAPMELSDPVPGWHNCFTDKVVSKNDHVQAKAIATVSTVKCGGRSGIEKGAGDGFQEYLQVNSCLKDLRPEDRKFSEIISRKEAVRRFRII